MMLHCLFLRGSKVGNLVQKKGCRGGAPAKTYPRPGVSRAGVWFTTHFLIYLFFSSIQKLTIDLVLNYKIILNIIKNWLVLKLFRIFYTCIIFLFIIKIPVFYDNQLILTQDSEYYILGKYLEIFEDPHHKLTFKEIS